MKMMDDHIISKKDYEKILFRFFIFPLAMFIQFILLPRLPEKYFYDSNYILSIFLGEQVTKSWTSWTFTSYFFHLINFFHFTELTQWSYFLSLIFNLIIFFLSFHYKFSNLFDYLFFYCSVGLLNIYVFRMSKEIIQFLIFLVAVVIIKSSLSFLWKILSICLLFISEGVVFRSYYFLIAVLFLTLIFLLRAQDRRQKKHWLFFFAMLCFLGLIGLKFFSYRTYLSIVTVRDSLTLSRQGSEDANTLILNLIPTNGSLVLFLLDYVINFVRLMLPIELFPKGPAYYLFIFFQLYLSGHFLFLFRNGKQNLFQNNQQKLLFSMIVSYYTVSALFEPDFGSFIRHEAAFFPILFELFYGPMALAHIVEPVKSQSKYIYSSGCLIVKDQ